MAIYTTTKFGASEQYEVRHIEGSRLYVFTPYYVEVTGTSANQIVSLTFNGITIQRNTNASYKAKFPISKLLQTAFAGLDFGDILYMEGDPVFSNTESKLVKSTQSIVVKVGTDTNPGNISYDLIWGALQPNQFESNIQRILWAWQMPEYYMDLIITDNIGSSTKGRDIWVSEWLNVQEVRPEKYNLLDSFSQVVRSYVFRYMPYCSGGLLLRWIDVTGEYKHYYFKISADYYEEESGRRIHQNIWDYDSKSYIGDFETAYDKKVYKIYEIGIPAADYDQQLMMQSLQTSLKQYALYDPENTSVYTECEVEVEPIIIDRFKSPKEISIKVKFPIYTQSL